MIRPPENGSPGDWLRPIVEEFEGPLTRYASRVAGSLELGREVAQETFLKLCQEDRARLEGRLGPWLFAVCRRAAIDVRRKEERMTTLVSRELDTLPVGDRGPAELAEERDTHLRVLNMLTTLPENQQEVVRLKFQNQLSYAEIARVTELSVSNVGVLLHMALKTIRQRLAT